MHIDGHWHLGGTPIPGHLPWARTDMLEEVLWIVPGWARKVQDTVCLFTTAKTITIKIHIEKILVTKWNRNTLRHALQTILYPLSIVLPVFRIFISPIFKPPGLDSNYIISGVGWFTVPGVVTSQVISYLRKFYFIKI